jgi:REP element-mobilizing transposase RayT
MAQSLSKNYVHIVFSTKNREPLIDNSFEDQLYSYIAAIAKNHESPCIQIGGFDDHIHVLCDLSRKIALMTLVQKIKSNSSLFIKSNQSNLGHFNWQGGYGAFSVGQNELDNVSKYIKNQREHHKTETFQNEMRRFYKHYQIPINEKYVWG